MTGTFLLPANICESVPETFCEAGCDVRFVDIDADTLCIDEQKVLEHIADCAGVLAVHTYGLQCSFDSFYAQVRFVKPTAIIIDDRCLCWPDFEYENLYANAEADLTLFSLGDKKQVQLGEGGVGIIADCRWRMGDCSWVLDVEKYWKQKQVARAHVAKMQKIYAEQLPKEIQLPMEYNNWRFNIRVSAEKKDTILNVLFANGLFASSHYKSLAENAETITPNAVKLQQEFINLFEDPKYYAEEQARKTCQIINEILQQQ